jgi:hypothetical protein
MTFGRDPLLVMSRSVQHKIEHIENRFAEFNLASRSNESIDVRKT